MTPDSSLFQSIMDNKRKRAIAWGCLYAALVLLCAFFVNTHDDYYIPETGNSFIGSVQYALTMGNGRYIGNLLGNFLSQRGFINCLIKAAVLWGIMFLILSFFPGNALLSVLTILLVLWPGTGIFAQCYGWSHGFYNYVVPVFLLLAVTRILLSRKESAGWIIVSILCALAQMLFSENTSIIALLAALFFLLLSFRTKEVKRSLAIAVFAAAVVGIALMFLGPKLSLTADKMDWYRGSYSLSDIGTLIHSVTENVVYIFRCMIEWHMLWLSIFVLLGIQIIRSRKASPALFLCTAVTAAAMIVVHTFLPEDDIPHMTLLVVLLFVFTLLSTLYMAISCSQKATLRKAALPFILAVLSAGQLLIVYPIGPRCLYITYILLIISVLTLWQDAIPGITDKGIRHCTAGFTVLLCLAYLLLLITFIGIFRINSQRVEYIEEQLSDGKTSIEVIALPDNGLLWVPNATSLFQYTFNLGNPNDMSFEIVAQ